MTELTQTQLTELLDMLEKLARTLSTGVKTRDCGRCVRCGRATSSGMDPYCHRCVGAVARECYELLKTVPPARARPASEPPAGDGECWGPDNQLTHSG